MYNGDIKDLAVIITTRMLMEQGRLCSLNNPAPSREKIIRSVLSSLRTEGLFIPFHKKYPVKGGRRKGATRLVVEWLRKLTDYSLGDLWRVEASLLGINLTYTTEKERY